MRGGNVAAEYSNVLEASACGTPTCYVAQDHLGSTRMLTDSAGNVQRRYDYQPFGQEVQAGIGSRTTLMGYLSMPDDTNPKFTGQQRDADTGLDWFQVRHMSGAAGRFRSPDPGNAGPGRRMWGIIRCRLRTRAECSAVLATGGGGPAPDPGQGSC